MKIAVLASNFSGNVGDLYILRSVTEFVSRARPNATLKIFPRASRFSPRVACAEQIFLPQAAIIEPHRFSLRGTLEITMRRQQQIEQTVTSFYFRGIGRAFHSTFLPLTEEFDQIIVLGGEMEIPYSFFDVHDYIANLTRTRKTPIIYGPISLTPNQKYLNFVQRQLSTIECVAVRDPRTLAWLQSNGIKNTQLVPDCAFLSWTAPSVGKLRNGRIGLCLHTGWAGRLEQAYKMIDQALAVARAQKGELCIYATHAQEDYQLQKLLVRKYGGIDDIKFRFPLTTDEFIGLSRSIDLVISDRLHALLVGILHGANALPILTRHKVSGYRDYLGLREAIEPSDSQSEIFRKISTTLIDQNLSRHLNKFCQESHSAISNFFESHL